jgi:DNA-binding response OmpR family regulator
MPEKILIVDDDIETLRLVGLMLQRQGFKIIAANNGQQALAMSKAEIPDLILLDIMMPDMDGYEVTKQIRSDPATKTTPIIMFTAKSMVDDKVAGFDAGVDDYLTKPTHPAELTAHVKALLARNAKRAAPATEAPAPKGLVCAMMAAKGGIGCTTLAVNVGVALRQRTKAEVIVAEMRPSQGTLGIDLGYTNVTELDRLLKHPAEEITQNMVQNELVLHSSGVRLLLASYQPKDIEYTVATEKMTVIVNHLASLGQYVLLDIGANILPGIDKVLDLCSEAILAVEPMPNTISRTKVLLSDLSDRGFSKSRVLSLVLINRIRSDIQMSWTQVQEALGLPITSIITPAPELAYQACSRSTPMILAQPDGIVAQQYIKIATALAQRGPQK